MATNAFPTGGQAGVNLLATYVSAGVAPFSLGKTVPLSDGGRAMFVCSSVSAVSQFACVAIAKNFKVNMATTGNVRSFGNQIAFAGDTSIATGACGWVRWGGRPKVNLGTNCAPFVNLYTTSTAGTLNSTTVSGSGGLVCGVFATASISNATAVTCIVADNFANSVVGT